MDKDWIAKHGLTEYGVSQARFDFGVVLWKILAENKKINYIEAANRLDITKENLRNILHGKACVSQDMIKKWVVILPLDYPETWEENKVDFKNCAAALKGFERKPQYGEPEHKDSLGYVLWLILGGEKASMKEAAEHLKISPSNLSRILHGRVGILEKTILDKGWIETLARQYPETWKEYGPVFEEYVAKLPTELKNRSNEPADKNSIGHVLWLIIGGKDANIKKSAKLLGIHPSYLSKIIHNRMSISSDAMGKRHWQKTLEINYPKAWEEYGPIFVERLNNQENAHKLTAPKSRGDIKSLPQKGQIKGYSPS